MSCVCDSIGRSDLRMCATCHRYWQGDRELYAVSKVIRTVWPVKRDFDAAPPDVLEHARERGVRVDTYFQYYLTTGTVTTEPGEWDEVLNLLKMLVRWWDKHGRDDIKPQVIRSDGVYAGTPDFYAPGVIWDLKCTYNLETTYDIALGGYASMGAGPIKEMGILHAAKRFKEVRFVPLDIQRCMSDWNVCEEMFQLVQRRGK